MKMTFDQWRKYAVHVSDLRPFDKLPGIEGSGFDFWRSVVPQDVIDFFRSCFAQQNQKTRFVVDISSDMNYYGCI